MLSSSPDGLTQLLARAREGDRAAASEAFTRLNSKLREIANRLFAAELPGNTLQPTVLVNEVWLKMQERDGRLNMPDLQSRGHFCILAARVMREILVEHAREKRAAKRGGGRVKISMDGSDFAAPSEDSEVLALNESLQRLEVIRPRAAKVVQLKFFGGCTIPETAVALSVSPETVKNDWRFAKAWLRKELQDHGK